MTSVDFSKLWEQIETGDTMFKGDVDKQSEVLGRWNPRYVQVVRVDSDVIMLFYWLSRSSQESNPTSPRGGFVLTNCSVTLEPKSMTVSLKHISDAFHQGDCFGSRADLVENIRCHSNDDFSVFCAAVGASIETEPVPISMVTVYDKEVPTRTDSGNTKPDDRLNTEYKLLGELGRGAFSVVYRGKRKISSSANQDYDGSTSDEVAIKVVFLQKFTSREKQNQLRYLNSEVSIMRKITKALPQCKQVVHLYDNFSETKPEPRYCMVLELCNGGELFDRIVQKNCFSEVDAKNLMLKIATCLRDLHRIGIVHRDIKPENLIYDTPAENAEIKLTDFGLSLDMSHHETDVFKAHVVGTCGYFAPEVLTLQYGPACDVWSLGVVLYILLCGYPPFAGRNNAEIQKKSRMGQFEFHTRFWAHVSVAAQDLIRKMLTVRSRARVSMDDVLAHPWFKVSSESDRKPISLESHRAFNNKRKLKAAAYAVIWSSRLKQKKKDRLTTLAHRLKPGGLNENDLEVIKESFSIYAKNNESGNLSLTAYEDFESVMTELGYPKLPLKRLFKIFDENADGTIDYRELLTGLAGLQNLSEDSIKFCFSIYDIDGNGEIDKDELLEILSMSISNSSADPHLVSTELADAFEEIDVNGDGVITFDEFKQACEMKPYLKNCFFSKRLSNISTASGSRLT